MAATLPRNEDLADRFELLADLSEILGEQSFRVAAYRRAAVRIRDTASSVAELALEGKAKELPDIGKTIEAKIVEVVETGDMEALAKRRAEVPGEVASFMRLPGLGPKTAARIWRELGVTTLAELKAAAEGQRLRTLSGLGPTTEAKVLKALAEGQGAEQPRRGLLGKGLPVVREVVETLAAHPAALDVSEAGSARRRRETFRDLDVIATASDPAALTAYFVGLPWVLEVVAHGDTKATVITRQGLRLDLRVVPPESYGDLLQHFTGSKEHNVALREQAQRRRLLGLRVRRHRGRERKGPYLHGGGGALRVPRLPLHPARAAGERRRAGGGARGPAAGARRAGRPARGDALPLDLVGGRQGDDRGDGARGGRRAATSSSASRTTRTTCGKESSSSSGTRSSGSTRASPRSASCAASRRTSPRGASSTSPTRPSPSSTGSSRRCTPRSTAARPSACSRRSTTRTWTASGT